MTTYSEVREQIKDGTVVFLSGHTLGQHIIQFFTFGRLTHCGIAFWVTETSGKQRLMCAESTSGGVRLINLGAYERRPMILVDMGIDWDTISEAVSSSTGTIHYSLLDFVLIGYKGIMRKLGLKVSVKNMEGEVCSEFVARILQQALVNATYIDPMLSPSDLFEAIKYRALNIIELEATK